eukprot:scaffold181725_cov22-Tisochrysis_lutea.AAC.1
MRRGSHVAHTLGALLVPSHVQAQVPSTNAPFHFAASRKLIHCGSTQAQPTENPPSRTLVCIFSPIPAPPFGPLLFLSCLGCARPLDGRACSEEHAAVAPLLREKCIIS